MGAQIATYCVECDACKTVMVPQTHFRDADNDGKNRRLAMATAIRQRWRRQIEMNQSLVVLAWRVADEPCDCSMSHVIFNIRKRERQIVNEHTTIRGNNNTATPAHVSKQIRCRKVSIYSFIVAVPMCRQNMSGAHVRRERTLNGKRGCH